jgi:uncharacterized protein (TIGR02145 family)
MYRSQAKETKMKTNASKITSSVLVSVLALTACKNASQKPAESQEAVQATGEKNTVETAAKKTAAALTGVKIGDHTWSDKNLAVATFRNGDAIPEAKTAEEWKKALDAKTPAWCNYDFDPAKGEKYGKLYNWFAVNDPRGLAPAGWHIPKTTEYLNFTAAQGGYEKKEEMTKNIKAAGAWGEQPAANSTGFSALAGGSHSLEDGFVGEGVATRWWGIVDKGDEKELGGPFTYQIEEEYGLGPNWNPLPVTSGAYVRCIKDQGLVQ